MLLALLRALRRGGAVECVVPAEDPEGLARAHAVESFAPSDLPRLLAAAEAADLVVVGPGGLLHDYAHPRPETMLTRAHFGLAYYCGIPWYAAQLGRTVMLYGVGAGPLLFDESRDLVRDLVHCASAITTRDRPSAALLAEMRPRLCAVEEAADPAWRLVPVPGRDALAAAHVPEGRWLGLALRNWDLTLPQAAWEQAVVPAAASFARARGLGLLFVPFQHNRGAMQDDLALARRLAGTVPGVPVHVVEHPLAPETVAGIIAACAAMVAMRYHALVFAALSGVPSVALAYDPKLEHLAEQLAAGVPVLPLSGLTASALEDALASAWEGGASQRARLLDGAARLRARAARSEQAAAELLRLPAVSFAHPSARRTLELLRLAEASAP